jgi:hypothetical protein
VRAHRWTDSRTESYLCISRDVLLEKPLTSGQGRHVAIPCHCMPGKGETEVEDLSKGASEQLNQAVDQAKDAAGEAIDQAKDILPGS